MDIVWPAWQLACVLFLIGLAWYPCCGESQDLPPCTYCTSDSDTVTLTFTGISDGGTLCTGCEVLNGTAFVLNRMYTNACGWERNWSAWYWCDLSALLVGVIRLRAYAAQLGPGTNKGWLVYVSNYGGTAYVDEVTYIWNSGSSSAFDCTATQTASYSTHVPGTSGASCLYSGSSCQVN